MARIDRVKKKAVDVEAVFQDRLSRVAQDTEALLERLLAPSHLDGERARPKRLLEAMRYASLGGQAALPIHALTMAVEPRNRRLQCGQAVDRPNSNRRFVNISAPSSTGPW